MKFFALCLLALSMALAAPVSAQVITGDEAVFEEVADGVYAFLGKNNDANALVIVTDDGVVLVDTANNPPETRCLQEFIRSVTDQPVRYIVVSQNHGDHIGGTPLFAPPAQVIAHEKVAEHWAGWRPHQIASWRKRFPERTDVLSEIALTDNIMAFSDHMVLRLGGRVIELIYIDDPYNPGDIAIMSCRLCGCVLSRLSSLQVPWTPPLKCTPTGPCSWSEVCSTRSFPLASGKPLDGG